MRIIRHGNKRTIECDSCNCLFEYEREDVESTRLKINEYEYYVHCPDCRKRIIVPHFD